MKGTDATRDDGDVVVIAERDPDEASIIAAWLRRRDVHVVTADSGTRALTLAQELAPDWIFVNGLPDMSPVELAHRVRSNESLEAVRVVAVTDDHRALGNAFDGVLRRPLHGAQIDRLMDEGE